MSNFHVFAKAVNDKFMQMAKGEHLFVAGTPDVQGEDPSNRQHELVYLSSWPEGTNPVYKTNTEHDCSCCKQFIRNIGPVVSINGPVLDTVWNVKGLPFPYDVVARAMDDHIRSLPIKQLFQATEPQYGAEHNLQLADGKTIKWNHFWAKVPAKFVNKDPGTLAVDLSEGMDVESAVRGFESKVAPTNYKRPKALVTQAMIKDAMATIKELDMEDALVRRHAQLSDVSVNDVLWADSSAKASMKGGLEDLLLASAVTATVDDKQVCDITWAEFQATQMLKAQGMEVMFKNTSVPNLMSITAPVHSGIGLFKWGNDFAWSYNGNVTDSIKDKVKAAGGNVTNAKLRFSLAWYNYDDLDLYVTCPDGGRIYFCRKKCGGGELDVDMNAGGRQSREPVENVSFTSLQDGVYIVQVNQYSKRETSNEGFTVEVESGGVLNHYSYKYPVKGTVTVGKFTVKSGLVVAVAMGDQIEGTALSQTAWGLETEKFVPVNTVMYSPNHWNGQAVGNKHVFFILRGCLNDQPCRDLYNEFLSNEFLSNELEKHKRVFELLGEKTKCPVVEKQLSGVGYSSTKGESVMVRVKTAKGTRIFNVKF